MAVSNRYSFVCILILRCYEFIEGFHSLSPLGAVHVCLGSEDISLNCVTDRKFMEWNITAHNYIGLKLISSRGSTDPLTVNYTTFLFTRESLQPLNVTLTIVNATVDMTVYCIDNFKIGAFAEALVTAINVISSESDVFSFLDGPDFIATEESFAQNNVSIEVHLKKLLNQESLYSASFTITPRNMMNKIMVTDNDSAVITIPYNTLYNVSVIGTADICGYRRVFSSILTLFYANCGVPISPQDGYLDPFSSTLEGAEVNITCLSGWLVKLTCDHNGRWQPNLNDICISNSGNSSSSADKIIIPVIVVTGVIFTAMIIILLVYIILKSKRCRSKARETSQYRYFADENNIIESDTDT